MNIHACFPLSLYLSTQQCMSTWHATEGNVQQGNCGSGWYLSNKAFLKRRKGTGHPTLQYCASECSKKVLFLIWASNLLYFTFTNASLQDNLRKKHRKAIWDIVRNHLHYPSKSKKYLRFHLLSNASWFACRPLIISTCFEAEFLLEIGFSFLC